MTALFFLCILPTKAQKGNNELIAGVEATVPFFQNDHGGGIYFKGAYGTGKSAQITLTAGVSKFTAKRSVEIQQATKAPARLLDFQEQYAGHNRHTEPLHTVPGLHRSHHINR